MKKRHRSSIYDPHREDIEEWCSQGITVKEMAERLGVGYYEQGIYAYIKAHGLRTKAQYFSMKNHCNECEHCHLYTNLSGNTNRICALSWRTIQKNVVCCPTWCEK